jgi:Ribbon-helix-helix protein, copG family
MRTTVDLDADTAAAVEHLRREEKLGLSEAVNQLIRRGLRPRAPRPPYVPRTHALGLRIDVSNVADALEALEGSEGR